MEQQIKPHRNLFTPTIAQKNKHLTTTALLPKAKYYRTYLEPYLNDVVYIECARWYSELPVSKEAGFLRNQSKDTGFEPAGSLFSCLSG